MAIKSEYYLLVGGAWELHYFKTSADLIVETTSYKVLTADERTAISDYLTGFNTPDKLVKIDASGYIPEGLIPDLTNLLLSTGGGTLTGALAGTQASFSDNIVTPTLFVNIINSEGGSVSFSDALDNINFNNVVMYNVPTPTLGHHAANKEYVDNLAAEGVRPISPVKCATVANVALSGLVTIDGYTLLAGDRVLVKNQTTSSQNGIYVAATGAWTKVESTVKGLLVFVENGNTYNDWKFYANSTTTWIEFSKVDTILAGSGLAKAGTTISVSALGITNSMLAGSINWNKLLDNAAVDNANDSFDAWTDLTSAVTSKSLYNHLSMIMAAIGLLRGTANYNTNNTQNIAGAYSLANSKARIEKGSTLPAVAGYNTGDVYLKTLA